MLSIGKTNQSKPKILMTLLVAPGLCSPARTISLDLLTVPAAGRGGTSDVDTPASAPMYKLKGRGKKRGRELEEAGMSEGNQAEGAADADAIWEGAESAYHLDLVKLLRQPRMYRALGLSGPPHCIMHSSLEERLKNMQLVH